MTNSQQNVTQVRRLFDEVYTKGNVNTLDELFAQNVRLVDPAQTKVKEGLQALKSLESVYMKAFPGKRTKIDDVFATDDRVVVRWTCEGVHKGPLQGIEPTNSPFKVTGISIYRFSNGKIVEINQIFDRLGLLEQIGEVQPALALH
jgi:steroid delta-isomerase-like uncharacterized protein